MGNLDSISIMKKRNLGINEANHRFQQSRPAAEFGENQKKFIQVKFIYSEKTTKFEKKILRFVLMLLIESINKFSMLSPYLSALDF